MQNTSVYFLNYNAGCVMLTLDPSQCLVVCCMLIPMKVSKSQFFCQLGSYTHGEAVTLY